MEQFENISEEKQFLEKENKEDIELKSEPSPEKFVRFVKQFEIFWETLDKAVPEDRNFEVELKKDDNENYSIFLQKDGGEIKDLSSYLPEGYKFKAGEEFVCNYKKQEIVFKKEDIKFRGFLIKLFHELGHANHENDPVLSLPSYAELADALLVNLTFVLEPSLKIYFQEKIQKKMKEEEIEKFSSEEMIKMIKEEFVKEGFMEGFLGEEKSEKLAEKIASLIPSYQSIVSKSLQEDIFDQIEETTSMIPEWFFDRISRPRAKSERNAWGYALRQLKKLHKEEYNVLAGFDNSEEIRLFIAYCLFTYDLNLENQLEKKLLFTKLNIPRLIKIRDLIESRLKNSGEDKF